MQAELLNSLLTDANFICPDFRPSKGLLLANVPHLIWLLSSNIRLFPLVESIFSFELSCGFHYCTGKCCMQQWWCHQVASTCDWTTCMWLSHAWKVSLQPHEICKYLKWLTEDSRCEIFSGKALRSQQDSFLQSKNITFIEHDRSSYKFI